LARGRRKLLPSHESDNYGGSPGAPRDSASPRLPLG
jgi:hypothetical protein